VTRRTRTRVEAGVALGVARIGEEPRGVRVVRRRERGLVTLQARLVVHALERGMARGALGLDQVVPVRRAPGKEEPLVGAWDDVGCAEIPTQRGGEDRAKEEAEARAHGSEVVRAQDVQGDE